MQEVSDASGPRPHTPWLDAPRWIALTGPTASGKSSVALRLAREWPIEIISMDSALVYRGMDVGTAKPTREDQAAVPHHLLDLLDPSQSYSAAAFVRDAHDAVQHVVQRGRVPLIVGGTLLYLHAWLHGLDELPAADTRVRAALDARASQVGWPAMHEALARVDPVTAERLSPQDAQRIQRALEVWELSGRPLSWWHTRSAAQPSNAGHRIVSLEPASRAWLHDRIAKRFEAMLDQGLVDEVRGLRARGDLVPSLPSMRCVGYRQCWDALESGDMASLHERGVAATRQLAKRQLTWLRGMPQRHVVACDADDDQVYAAVRAQVQALMRA